jgi:hypothetical protein
MIIFNPHTHWIKFRVHLFRKCCRQKDYDSSIVWCDSIKIGKNKKMLLGLPIGEWKKSKMEKWEFQITDYKWIEFKKPITERCEHLVKIIRCTLSIIYFNWIVVRSTVLFVENEKLEVRNGNYPSHLRFFNLRIAAWDESFSFSQINADFFLADLRKFYSESSAWILRCAAESEKWGNIITLHCSIFIRKSSNQ